MVAFKCGWSLQLPANVVTVIWEGRCANLSMRSGGVGRRAGYGAGKAEQVPVEFVILQIGGNGWRRNGYAYRRRRGSRGSNE